MSDENTPPSRAIIAYTDYQRGTTDAIIRGKASKWTEGTAGELATNAMKLSKHTRP